MSKRNLLFLFLFALLFCFPFLLNISSTFPRLDSDYDAVLPIYQYIGNYIRFHRTFPSTIPFVAGGIPILGDPVNAIFNPLFLIPLIFFDINVSIRITFFLIIFVSGLTMYLFLKQIKVSQFLRLWGAFLYMSSGIVAACISTGHITEKFLTIPLLPLFFLFESTNKVSLKKTLLLGLIIAVSVYSGDLYGVWFSFIFLFCIETFYFLVNVNDRVIRSLSFLGIIASFAVLSSPILYAFFTHVYPIMRRPTVVDPFLGSVHAFILPLQFIVPFQVNFYDRPFFQRHIGFYYNWYEYYGFLGLFPILFIKNLKKVWKNTFVKIIVLLIFVGSLYLASKYVYSPFHWIFILWKGTNVFRVPQRIVIPLTPIVIALFCLLANTWKNNRTLYLICTVSIIWTIGVGWFTFSNTFVKQPTITKEFVKKFSVMNKEKKPVIDLIPQTQYYLADEEIPIFNYYYAWVPKNIPIVTSEKGVIYKKAIKNSQVQFILSTEPNNFSDVGYKDVYSDNGNVIWEKIQE